VIAMESKLKTSSPIIKRKMLDKNLRKHLEMKNYKDLLKDIVQVNLAMYYKNGLV
jgi:hypothetical protein